MPLQPAFVDSVRYYGKLRNPLFQFLVFFQLKKKNVFVIILNRFKE